MKFEIARIYTTKNVKGVLHELDACKIFSDYTVKIEDTERFIEIEDEFVSIGNPVIPTKNEVKNIIDYLKSLHGDYMNSILKLTEWLIKHDLCFSFYSYNSENINEYTRLAYSSKEEIDESTMKMFGKKISDLTESDIILKKEEYKWKNKGVEMREDIIILENGNRLVRHYGKYKSGLTIIVSSVDDFNFSKVNLNHMNLGFDGDTEVLTGEFFVSKKGTKCFRVNPNGNQFLIRVDWGGSFNKTRGLRDNPPKDNRYYRRATSNRGRSGYDYIVLDKNFKNSLSEDEI